MTYQSFDQEVALSPLRGLSWGGGRSRVLATARCVALVAPATVFVPVAGATTETGLVSVIARGEDGAPTDALSAAVAEIGGVVTLELGLIDGVAADVPTAAVTALVAHPQVASVVPDGRMSALGDDHDTRDHDDEWERDNDYLDSHDGTDDYADEEDGDMPWSRTR